MKPTSAGVANSHPLPHRVRAKSLNFPAMRPAPRAGLRFGPRVRSWPIERYRETVRQSGFGPEAELISGLARVPDGHPHLAKARRPMIGDELGAIQGSHGLGKSLHRGPRAGADVEYQSTSIRRCRALQRAETADIGEITDLLAVAEDLYRLAASQAIGENRHHPGILRPRILSWPVEVEKAQAERRYSMHRAGNPRVKLASTLVGTIRTEWRRWKLLPDWNNAAVTVHSSCRRINDGNFPSASEPPCLIKDVDRAGEIYLMCPPPFAAGTRDRRN